MVVLPRGLEGELLSLSVTHNKLTSFPSLALRPLHHLQTLHIDNNALTQVLDTGHWTLETGHWTLDTVLGRKGSLVSGGGGEKEQGRGEE